MARSKAGRAKGSKRLGYMPVIHDHRAFNRNRRRSHTLHLRGTDVALPTSITEAERHLSDLLGIKCRFVKMAKNCIKLIVNASIRVREELSSQSKAIARAIGYKKVTVVSA